MRGFCYRCGHEGELLDGLCKICYSQLHPLFNIPDEIKVEVCHMCGSYKRRTWQDPKGRDLYEILDEIAYYATKDNLKTAHKNINIEIIPQEPRQLPGGKKSRVEIPVKIIATGKLPGEDEERTEEKDIVVYLIMVQCPRCSRYMSNYYEATLQVRAMNRFLTEEEKKELDDFVKNETNKRLKKDRMAFISKFIPQKEGLDYQIGSMGGARNIASVIKSKYGGKINETAKLVGVEKDTGKNQYRITIVVRIPEYKVGDVVEYNNEPHEVVSMNENKLYLEKLSDKREKISLQWNDAEKNTKLLKKGDECPTATVISVSPNTIIAMDNQNYEIYEYNNIFKDIKEGNILKIFKNENISYIVETIK
ncbi:60S ribosomal export protein NMD3 [Methanothermococcus sp.]|uniref:60S ribosomal export protein NMD3 n=1 Tax=Methanothermococcus sp. TaxID=2614238 RepID=UPI0025E2D322|nr:60S ribosomal export protein NMD3 [Methanothermococcus sp.]